MRLLPPALLVLAITLACGGATDASSVASAVSPTIPADVTRGEDGQWSATPEGACAHLIECGCPPVPSFQGCVLQQELGMKAVGGVLELQQGMLDLALGGEAGPEAEMVRSVTRLGHGLVEGGVKASLAAIATMECEPLCAEMARMKEEAARGE